MPEAPDLASALLAADTAERERLMRNADPAMLEVALGTLGHRRESAAADVLALVEQVVDDRAVKKAARRELHRLRSSGMQIQAPLSAGPSSEPPAVRTERVLEASQAWVTDVDASGSRALWLLADRPLGGVWLGALLINDQQGLLEMTLVDTTRKRFQREFDASRDTAVTWVSLPGEYALRLVRESVDLTHAAGTPMPARYRGFRDVFGEAPSGPERALVYETVSPIEANFNPEWLEESQRLLSEPEIGGWYVSLPAELRSRAIEVARASSASLIVPGHTPEQQALQLLSEASQLGLTSVVRRALRRRLEETAYIFLVTDRLGAARLAVAAARGLEETGVSSSVPVERHPLLRMFLAAGLARLVTSTEMVGTRPVSRILLDLIERASQRGAEDADPVETRPSGLILPR